MKFGIRNLSYERIILLKIIIPAFLFIYLNNSYSINCSVIKISNDTNKESNVYIIKKVEINGNKRTKKKIITRELMFKENDTINKDVLEILIQKSRQNLLNTALFNFVTIDTAHLHPEITQLGGQSYQTIIIKINVIERWYIWPVPIFELSYRNFTSWWQTKEIYHLDYGFHLILNNFRGRKETLTLTIRHGYDEVYSLSYLMPFINKAQSIGLGINAGYTRNSEITYCTIDDVPEYYKNISQYPMTRIYSGMRLFSRPDIYNTQSIDVNYNHLILSDTINCLNKDYSICNKTNVQYMTVHYKYLNDYRDSKPYPLTGHYFSIDITKYGLYNVSGSPNFLNIHSAFNYYLPLTQRYFLSLGVTGSYTNTEKQPYYLASAIGYGRDNIRGYDLYVINGQYFGIGKFNLTYNILPTQVYNIKFIPTEKFSKIHYALYLNLFADCGYVYDNNYYPTNCLANQLLYSTGIGLDFVTYYDKVLRVEYAINKERQTGIFINFVAPL